jgi:TRAP-type C4-dicarboxylate transport system permease small subunit
MDKPTPLGRAVEAFDRATRWLAIAGGVVLVAMVLLTVVDVALRKFHEPIFGRQNISELALLVVVFFSMAYCGRVKGHVAVDLIGNVASRRLLRVTDVLVSLIGAAVFAILTWRSLIAAEHAMEIKRVSNLLAIPHWPFYYVIALGSTLYAIVQIIDAARAFRGRDAPSSR